MDETATTRTPSSRTPRRRRRPFTRPRSERRRSSRTPSSSRRHTSSDMRPSSRSRPTSELDRPAVTEEEVHLRSLLPEAALGSGLRPVRRSTSSLLNSVERASEVVEEEEEVSRTVETL